MKGLPKPYYSDGKATIFHARCEGVLPEMEAASVDLIATDPPYFRVKNEAWDRAWKDRDAFLSWLGRVADEWRRVLKPNGGLYCFAGPKMAARVEVMLSERFNVLN
ncbi:MAG: site-specific DNA-methyltransferase, partial [Actinomycetota bacterium]|nr:site-specific DNA-methyltransferase [Actinomycetota bacterium]